MAIIRASVRIPNDSGLSEDAVFNNFHFSTGDVAGATLDALVARVSEFYNTAIGGGNKVSDFLSDFLDGANATIKLVNMSEPTPRFPLRDQAMPISIPAGNGFPNEVAIVMSFQGAKVSGENQARKRGRIYLGPVKASTATAATGEMRVSSGVRSVLGDAMDRLATAPVGALYDWIVYSAGARDNSDDSIPYEVRDMLAPTFAPVDNGWIDDAYDTQRRRGRKATGRTLWTNTPA